MAMIGNAQDAQLIRNRVSRIGYSPCKWDAPEGWDYLGEGSFRSAWLSPEGVVYKVQHRYEVRKWDQTNEDEFNSIKRIMLECTPLKGVRIPRSTYYTDSQVMAMEYVGGPTGLDAYGENSMELFDTLNEIAMALGLDDLHDENVLIDDKTGEIVIIDLGG